MEFRRNQGGEGAGAKADGGRKGTSYGFREKKGSVFPAKKKLVKDMMVECIAKSFSRCNKSAVKIFPHP
ncbi:hypothetical protein F3Y22_tig00112495pilonHSYRG00094 [Hibiscus syriacus]|uniref:Uncharacterized protein n=1 Tax=Hibiscus syriacus TaxID=106335 RepID=A0A6A2WXH9_HIBSY|nr:hypothetical protein F3Y22_tig00112495pilonHSYRG00094 [Hibiscus syriacus]